MPRSFLDEGGLGRGRTVQRRVPLLFPSFYARALPFSVPCPRRLNMILTTGKEKKHETPLTEVIPTFYVIVYIPRQVTVQNARCNVDLFSHLARKRNFSGHCHIREHGFFRSEGKERCNDGAPRRRSIFRSGSLEYKRKEP